MVGYCCRAAPTNGRQEADRWSGVQCHGLEHAISNTWLCMRPVRRAGEPFLVLCAVSTHVGLPNVPKERGLRGQARAEATERTVRPGPLPVLLSAVCYSFPYPVVPLCVLGT